MIAGSLSGFQFPDCPRVRAWTGRLKSGDKYLQMDYFI